jgi:hypothetical protein
VTCPHPTSRGPCGALARPMDSVVLTDLIAETTVERVRYVCGVGHSCFRDELRAYQPMTNTTPQRERKKAEA